MKEWLGVDLDGTLAEYDGWVSHDHIGAPIQEMVTRVRKVLKEGTEVRIFTARCYPIVEVVRCVTSLEDLYQKYLLTTADNATNFHQLRGTMKAIPAIRQFSMEAFGLVLPITCVKDYGMSELWDDRAVGVLPNTGQLLSPSRRGFA
jgi:hypothetical protein